MLRLSGVRSGLFFCLVWTMLSYLVLLFARLGVVTGQRVTKAV